MNEYERFNKVSGVHWLKQPVQELEIRLKIKHEDIFDLPTHHDLESNTTLLSVAQSSNAKVHEHTFKWQEKVFSAWELTRYANSHNCISDTELKYHGIIKNNELMPQNIHTYVHEDNYYTSPAENTIKCESILDNVTSCFNALAISKNLVKQDTTSTGHLFRSEENICNDNEWISMYVVSDDSEYNEDGQLILKKETVLFSLHYQPLQQSLLVTPEVNNLEWNPYCIDSHGGTRVYSVELCFEEDNDGCEDLGLLLNQLQKRWRKDNRQHITFAMPPPGKVQYYVTLEILAAKGFDMDNLYIEYNIKLPDHCECTDPLHGRTHVSKAIAISRYSDSESDNEWCFGHVIELGLLVDDDFVAKPVQIFLETISTDWWGRQRTEGYCHLPLHLKPGSYHQALRCTRPEELDRVVAESRRFFVGGCHLLKDLDMLVKPDLVDANFRLVSTGTISTRHSVVRQSSAAAGSCPPATLWRPAASTADLLLGAEEVIRQYKKARARLAAATRDLDEEDLDRSVTEEQSD